MRNSTSTIIAESYAYSPTGKILTNGGVNYLYGTNLSHAPIGVASNTMSYDKRGRLSTSSEYGSFTFNSLDRLSEIKRGATTSKYYYDSEGNRLLSLTFSSTTLSSSTLKSRLFTPSSWVQDTGSTTSYAINLGSKPILSIERSIIPPVAAPTPPRLPPRTPPRISPRIPANVLTKTQLILDQEGTLSKDISTAINTIASATTTPTHTTSIHILITDHLNSIEKVLEYNTGSTISTSTYTSYGSLNKEGNTNSNRGYTNHQQDSSNLIYANARYLQANHGVFISSDSNVSNNVKSLLANPQDLNAYSYVRNNPVHYTDPTGNIIDTVADVGFIAYDIGSGAYNLYNGNYDEAKTDGLALLADIGGAFTPFSTGFGMGVRVSRGVAKAEKVESVVFEVIKKELPKSEKINAIEIGKYSADSISARSSARNFTKSERDAVNEIGKNSGCHTCGSKSPNTKSDNFVPDHQPISALNKDNLPQSLYPQCINCSRIQGGQVSSSLRGKK